MMKMREKKQPNISIINKKKKHTHTHLSNITLLISRRSEAEEIWGYIVQTIDNLIKNKTKQNP